MKKKVGVVEVIHKKTNEKKEIPIWGILFEGNNNKMVGGVYYNIKPDLLDEFFPFVSESLQRVMDFSMDYHKEFWGEYWRIGKYGNPKYINFDGIIRNFKLLPILETCDYAFRVKIDKDFQYVVDANVLEKI